MRPTKLDWELCDALEILCQVDGHCMRGCRKKRHASCKYCHQVISITVARAVRKSASCTLIPYFCSYCIVSDAFFRALGLAGASFDVWTPAGCTHALSDDLSTTEVPVQVLTSPRNLTAIEVQRSRSAWLKRVPFRFSQESCLDAYLEPSRTSNTDTSTKAL